MIDDMPVLPSELPTAKQVNEWYDSDEPIKGLEKLRDSLSDDELVNRAVLKELKGLRAWAYQFGINFVPLDTIEAKIKEYEGDDNENR